MTTTTSKADPVSAGTERRNAEWLYKLSDLEVSRHLALAIGWSEQDILVSNGKLFIVFPNGRRKAFDYKDPNVIWSIAKKYNCFPEFKQWTWSATIGPPWFSAQGNTSEITVARTVIGKIQIVMRSLGGD